jgi:uncharacterized protein (TIGR03435 family)
VLQSRTMKKSSRLTALLLFIIFALAIDEGHAQNPQFEVATVKPTTNGNRGINVSPSGLIVITGFPLKTVISLAFGVSPWQISGGEPWMEETRYRIDAKAAESSLPLIKPQRYGLNLVNDEHLRQLLQSLLIERFELKVRREVVTGLVYSLEKSGKTLRLKTTAPPAADAPTPSYSIGWADRWVIDNITMAQLANDAANRLQTPVLDRTGLQGRFDYRQPEGMDQPGLDRQSSFLQLLSEVGLTLKRTTGQIETFVIQSAKRPQDH